MKRGPKMAEKKKELTRDERILKEFRKIKRLMKNLPKNKWSLCEDLVQNAAFMTVVLKELQEEINENGAVATFTNGNGFEVTKESPAMKLYNETVTRYASVIRELNSMLPEEEAESKLEALAKEFA